MIPELEPETARTGRRRSVATRRVQPRAGMIRFVVDPQGRLVPDVLERLPGRGLWLEARRDLLVDRNTRRALARSGARIDDPERLAEEIAAALEHRCLDLLGLARRARQAVAGYEKVKEAVARGKVALLFVARDAGRDARTAFHRLPEGARRVVAFDRGRLGRALGRDEAVFVAVFRGRLARRLQRELERLAGFREVEMAPAPGTGREREDANGT